MLHEAIADLQKELSTQDQPNRWHLALLESLKKRLNTAERLAVLLGTLSEREIALTLNLFERNTAFPRIWQLDSTSYERLRLRRRLHDLGIMRHHQVMYRPIHAQDVRDVFAHKHNEHT
jgi:hypothetical protein